MGRCPGQRFSKSEDVNAGASFNLTEGEGLSRGFSVSSPLEPCNSLLRPPALLPVGARGGGLAGAGG